jgi:YegS/Rv2252/BmrU family lipid kinase
MQGRIIYNPTAGPRDVGGELLQVRGELKKRGWLVDIVETHGHEHATRLARGAAEAGFDAVWAAGGDGTVREVVNGLVHSDTALGVLPVGTGNLWAKQLRLPTYTLTHPFRLREAAISQVEGLVRLSDVGQVGGYYFLMWAGIGFDARIAHELEPRPRPVKRLGVLPYLAAGIFLAREYSGIPTRVVLDGRVVRGRTLLVLVTNVQNYTIFPISRKARMDDGLLDVLIFKGVGFRYIMRHILKVVSGRHLEDPKVIHRQARRITIQSQSKLSVQADGDPLGTTPVALRVIPGALRLLVPPQAPRELFSD